MKDLYIDIETFSPVDIGECGSYRYALDPDTRIILVAYAFGDEPVKAVTLKDELSLPEELTAAILDRNVRKWAHNAVFERTCFTRLFRRLGLIGPDEYLDPSDWYCTMALASRCGLPQSLAQVGNALGLEEQKMAEGKGLIQLFCQPVPEGGRLAKLFEQGTRVMPEDDPQKWEIFVKYCIRDVEVERNIKRRLEWYQTSDFEHTLYAVDQRVNDRGVLIDTTMAREAQKMDAELKARLTHEAIELTGLDNPNSPSQLKDWLGKKLGTDLTSLNKDTVKSLIGGTTDPTVRRVLQIRQEMSKTSCSKYDKMLSCAMADDRARGLLQFYGTRTGRWAGRLVQMQNLPQNHLPDDDLDCARGLLREGDYTSLDLIYGNVPDVMSQLIRTAFIAPENHTFAVCDFSAIEARVLAWLAGEDWVLEAFRAGKDIYCVTASKMFKVPVEKHGQNAELRQKGKVSVLALGYQGGVGALDKMGGQKLGMTEAEEKATVTMWRESNPHIVEFWSRVELAAKYCIAFKTATTVVTKYTSIVFAYSPGADTMAITLPSGRQICYCQPRLAWDTEWAYLDQSAAQKATNGRYISKEKKALHPEKYWKDSKIRFMTLNQETRKWEQVDTYGGKLTENITQAVGRDCLAEVLVRLERRDFHPVFHVHDEIICEVEERDKDTLLEEIQKEFAKSPEWAPELPLKGAGYLTRYYKKD